MSDHFSALLVGEASLLVQCAQVLLDRGHRVVGVVAADTAIGDWALQRGITRLRSIDDILPSSVIEPFDYLFSIANLQMLPARTVGAARRGAINFHDGPLPAYAGLYCTSWALFNREAEHGVTWHEMAERADTGRILVQERFPIGDQDTAFTLNARCYEVGVATFQRLVQGLESGTIEPVQQRAERRSYFGRRRRPAAMGILDWTAPAEAVDAQVRGLTFGPYLNPLCVPKLLVNDRFVAAVIAVERLDRRSGREPGIVVEANATGLVVTTATEDIRVTGLRTQDGAPLSGADLLANGLRVGDRLSTLPPADAARATALHEKIGTSEGFWAQRLETRRPTTLAVLSSSAGAPSWQRESVAVANDTRGAMHAAGTEPRVFLTGAAVAYLALLGDSTDVHVAFDTPTLRRMASGVEHLCATTVPMTVAVDVDHGWKALGASLARELAVLDRESTYLRDLPARRPGLSQRLLGHPGRLPMQISWDGDGESAPAPPEASLRLTIEADHGRITADFDATCIDPAAVRALLEGLCTFTDSLARNLERPLRLHPLAPAAVAEATATMGDGPQARIHELIAAQVALTPDAPAVVCRGQMLTYQELNRRANHVAHHLRALGAAPGQVVGLCTTRSANMVVGLLGILKSGAAYVPLDPGYPTDRLAVMIEDASVPILLTERAAEASLPTSSARIVRLDADWPVVSQTSGDDPAPLGTPDDLAYVIFTSGSTGRPKGVMVSHRNVANYFMGVDRTIGTAPGVWMAVTSISFDISVQELFWPLTHGFEIVIYTGDDRRAASATAPRATAAASDRSIDFSLFYFASDAGAQGKEKYRLLLEGARFADQHGFEAVWTPERHFHAFGGLYPNPSVASAALATITSRVKLRAGSVVSPLHSPIRIAEEWSLVDNLSGGRVGVSFAAGWQSNDFVLSSRGYADRKNIMIRDIDTVRRLWRGEPVEFVNGVGDQVPIRIMPRPVQQELPVWITAAGSPETFRIAGEIGANMLTHLLGQHLDELAEKIAIYRKAWKDAGHPGDGYVTLMLHTFVGDDTDAVREIVRGPFSDYLKSAVDLIKNAPAQFPTHKAPQGAMAAHLAKGMQEVTEEDLAALLDFAFERYFETSGLFGSVDRCLEIVETVRALGTDEIGCLIDFGVHPALVLPSLRHLNVVRERAQQPPVTVAVEETAAGLIRHHRVTHLQCTPSLMRLMLSDGDAAAALGQLDVLMLGGEALPPALADEVVPLVRGKVYNMYGPTETTIWSTTARVLGHGRAVSIGQPLWNQSVFVTNRHQQALPVGFPGELCIGGGGVVRGYWERPELTSERFTSLAGTHTRLYRTGDLAKWTSDGQLEFLGRLDHQVKIRGYRVELGEIESVLSQHASVAQAVVMAREDTPGDQRLVAYLIATDRHSAPPSELRAHLQGKLPDFMIPSTYVTLAAFPLTPNGKIDRRALPPPDRAKAPAAPTAIPAMAAGGSDLERAIAAVFAAALNVESVALHDNFFDLGAHSLLMVQVHSQLQETLQRKFPLIHLFRFPTVSALAAHLAPASPDAVASRGDDRADLRRASMSKRQQIRRQLTQG